ncbi:hypothetical protein B0H17DRAFT_1228741 [Mycena rosella]|uniref:Uncharacterized protein n=1 Tax=Mycena rosella TaxID=1033263 RepID=A0AAD7D798_MYCRO|nr:hypothetical protein B0H17DRAFT_1228741 [Mycena rosella]
MDHAKFQTGSINKSLRNGWIGRERNVDAVDDQENDVLTHRIVIKRGRRRTTITSPPILVQTFVRPASSSSPAFPTLRDSTSGVSVVALGQDWAPPALSTCLQSPDWYLIWMGSDQEKTFGATISALTHDNLPPAQYTLWDSNKRGGRPDIMNLLKEVYHSWGAEVVFITSNMGSNDEMMQALDFFASPPHVRFITTDIQLRSTYKSLVPVLRVLTGHVPGCGGRFELRNGGYGMWSPFWRRATPCGNLFA